MCECVRGEDGCVSQSLVLHNPCGKSSNDKRCISRVVVCPCVETTGRATPLPVLLLCKYRSHKAIGATLCTDGKHIRCGHGRMDMQRIVHIYLFFMCVYSIMSTYTWPVEVRLN